MPFETLETITKANMPPQAKISYMPAQRAGKNGAKPKGDAKPQLMITLPTTLCGVSKSKTFVLLLGTGEHVGKIRIKGAKSKAEGIEPKELRHSFVFRFGYVPKLGDDHFDGEHRPVKKLGDEEFEIDVPASWFDPQ